MSFYLGIADVDDGSGNNKTCITSQVDSDVVLGVQVNERHFEN